MIQEQRLNILEKCCILEKSRKKLVKFGEHSAKLWQNLRNFGKNRKQIQQFLSKNLRLESGAKECIVQISSRAFQRVFTCKIWLRYSRGRAYLILIDFSSLQRFNFDRALASVFHRGLASGTLRCPVSRGTPLPADTTSFHLCFF